MNLSCLRTGRRWARTSPPHSHPSSRSEIYSTPLLIDFTPALFSPSMWLFYLFWLTNHKTAMNSDLSTGLSAWILFRSAAEESGRFLRGDDLYKSTTKHWEKFENFATSPPATAASPISRLVRVRVAANVRDVFRRRPPPPPPRWNTFGY